MSKTLLLADDSPTIQRVVGLTFAQEDVRVVAFGDGEQAVKWMEEETPDIVLADVGMPQPDGYAVSLHIKQTPRLRGVPVLLLTGAFEPLDDARAKASSCDGILVKPFEPQHLVARVTELLAKPAPGAAPPAAPANVPEIVRVIANEPDIPLERQFEAILADHPEEHPKAAVNGASAFAAPTTAVRSSAAVTAPLSVFAAPAAPVISPTEHTATAPPILDVAEVADPAALTADLQTLDHTLELVDFPGMVEEQSAGLDAIDPILPDPLSGINEPATNGFEPAAPTEASEAIDWSAPLSLARATSAGGTSEAWHAASPPEAEIEPLVAGSPTLASAFTALLAAEQSQPAAVQSGAVVASEAAIEDVVRRVLARVTDEVVRQIVLETAERLIKEEIEKIKASADE